MTINDPVFGKIQWKHSINLWEGHSQLNDDLTFSLGVEPDRPKAPPSAAQRQGFVKLKDAWETSVRPEVAQKIWKYWKQGVERAGQFGSIPVDFDKADAITSPDDLYRTLSPATISIHPSDHDRFLAAIRFEWDWDLMGVVVKFVGTKVRKVTDFGDDDQSRMKPRR